MGSTEKPLWNVANGEKRGKKREIAGSSRQWAGDGLLLACGMIVSGPVGIFSDERGAM